MPSMANENLMLKGSLHIVLRDKDGRVKDERKINNLIVTVGKNGIADQLLASPTIGKPTHMAVGTGTNAAAAGDTTLQTENDRNALTSKTRSANVVTFVGDWAAGDATATISEAGLFDASSSGNMYARTVFTGIPKGASDSLTISWDITVG